VSAVTVPVELVDEWLGKLLAAATAEDRRSIGIAACGVGLARVQVTCTRCQPREVFFFTGAVAHLNARESAYAEQHHGELTGLHLPGDLRLLRPEDARGDRPIFWQTAQCRSCKAEVIWADTAKGKRMPVDATPNPAGTVVLVDQGVTNPPLAMVIHTEQEQASAPPESLHTSHFATCPNADRHRRR
jgi:hypothetical protein